MADVAYDRTNLADVIAEYQRQATLPSIILSAESMHNYAKTEIIVERFNKSVDNANLIVGEI